MHEILHKRHCEKVKCSNCVMFAIIFIIMNGHILKPSSNRSHCILTLVQKVKHKVYTIHAFLKEALLCQDSASISFKNDVYFLHERS